jgi:hypothetical protein
VIDPVTFDPTPVQSDWEWSATTSQIEEIKNSGYLTIQWKLNTPGYPNFVGFRPGYYMEAVAIGNAALQLSVGGE